MKYVNYNPINYNHPPLLTDDEDGKFLRQLLHVVAEGGGFLLLHSADAHDNDDGTSWLQLNDMLQASNAAFVKALILFICSDVWFPVKI